MNKRGFTLLEMSIVLIIVVLIIGAVAAGKEMVAMAAVRQQIKQIESFRTAATTFRLKYSALPGDIPNAATFGMTSRSGTLGHGNGDGMVNSSGNYQPTQCGEPSLFWHDLATAGMIEGGFKATDHNYGSGLCGASDTESLVPTAKIGDTNIIMANSDSDGFNYFTLCGGVEHIGTNGELAYNAAGSTNNGTGVVSGIQALLIDTKIDDGNPLTGSVNALNSCMMNPPWRVIAVPAAPTTGVCVSNATGSAYNQIKSTGGESLSCILRFRF